MKKNHYLEVKNKYDTLKKNNEEARQRKLRIKSYEAKKRLDKINADIHKN